MFQYFHCKLPVINDPAYLKSIKIFEALLYKENPSRYLLDICKIELKCKSQHLLNNDLKDDHTNFRSRKICLTFLIEKIGPDHSKQDFNARHQMVFIMTPCKKWHDQPWVGGRVLGLNPCLLFCKVLFVKWRVFLYRYASKTQIVINFEFSSNEG